MIQLDPTQQNCKSHAPDPIAKSRCPGPLRHGPG